VPPGVHEQEAMKNYACNNGNIKLAAKVYCDELQYAWQKYKGLTYRSTGNNID